MGRAKIGCCCGFIAGLCLFFLLLFAAGFGIYCYFCPEAWDRTVNYIENLWGDAKDGGDRVVGEGWEKVKEGGDHLVDAVSRDDGKQAPAVAEPEVKR